LFEIKEKQKRSKNRKRKREKETKNKKQKTKKSSKWAGPFGLQRREEGTRRLGSS
jgi:hypothetical protein